MTIELRPIGRLVGGNGRRFALVRKYIALGEKASRGQKTAMYLLAGALAASGVVTVSMF